MGGLSRVMFVCLFVCLLSMEQRFNIRKTGTAQRSVTGDVCVLSMEQRFNFRKTGPAQTGDVIDGTEI